MITKSNVTRYYPETNKTPKGHLNQSRKNVRSAKPKRTPLEVPKTAPLQVQKAREIYTSAYKVMNTVFYDQIGQFPTRSQWGNKYIMVVVEIDSNAIPVKPINNCKYEELTQAYRAIMLRLQRAVMIPRKHILDNDVSESLKTIIQDEYKIQLELVPPGTHLRNAAEVAIRNFKAHLLSILAVTAPYFPPSLWDRLLRQAEITINLLRQSNATSNVSAYAHLSGPFNYNKISISPMDISVQICHGK